MMGTKRRRTCLNDCQAARCGDSVVQVGVEACDDGNRRRPTRLNNCAAALRHGVVRAGVEACDDGNNNNDACSNTCELSCPAQSRVFNQRGTDLYGTRLRQRDQA